MTLLAPWMRLWALLLPLAAWGRRRRGEPALRFAPSRFVAGAPTTWRLRLAPMTTALQFLGLLLIVVALARPVRRVPLPESKAGIDLLLCLDVSSSMAANDLDRTRTRLDVAKEAAARFIAGRPDDRIGLLRFARYPDVVAPLTLDHGALAQLLAGVERVEADGPEDATGIGAAVARAAQLLRASTAKSKVVILLTDGAENVATSETPEEIAPLHAAQLCQELGVRVDTIVAGIGAPDRQGGWLPLDTSEVEGLSARTGGAFFTARDAQAVARVYAQIDALERVARAAPRFELRERFLPFLAAALLLLGASRLLQSSLLMVLP